MKIISVFTLLLCTSLFAWGFSDDEYKTTEQIFRDYQVTHPEKMTLSQNTFECFGGNCYYVNLSYAGKYENEDYKVTLSLETLTQKNYDRIFKAIQENYAKKGLPECLKKDEFFMTTEIAAKELLFQPKMRPSGRVISGSEIDMPATGCVDVENLYPN